MSRHRANTNSALGQRLMVDGALSRKANPERLRWSEAEPVSQMVAKNV